MTKRLGFGIIGCGGIAHDAHLPSLREIPEAETVAVSSRSEASARGAAERFGVTNWYTANDELITRDDIDVVIICTPPKFHKDLTVTAAQAGKHVLCEKPMARTLAECDEMIEATDEAGVKLMIAEMKRFNPGFRKAKEILAAGVVGDPFLVRYHNSYHEPHVREGWWVEPDISGGGELMNELTHQANTLRWMISEVAQVSCLTNNPWGPPPEDNAVVSLKFATDAIGVVTISWMTKEYNMAFPAPLDHAWDEQIEVFGTEGKILIQTPFPYWRIPLKLSVYTEKDIPDYIKGWNFPRVAATNQYVDQIRHFISCIWEDKVPEVSGQDGRADLEIVIAAQHSASSGKTVDLPL